MTLLGAHLPHHLPPPNSSVHLIVPRKAVHDKNNRPGRLIEVELTDGEDSGAEIRGVIHRGRKSITFHLAASWNFPPFVGMFRTPPTSAKRLPVVDWPGAFLTMMVKCDRVNWANIW